MNGRALLFKSIGRETSETRGGFTAVPAGLTLAQGAALLGTQAEQGVVVLEKTGEALPLHTNAALGARC